MRKIRSAVLFVGLLALLGCVLFLQNSGSDIGGVNQEEFTANTVTQLEFEQEVAQLMSQLERRLEEHHTKLQADGERAYQERQNEIVLEKNEELALAKQALEEEGEAFAAQLQKEYGIKILNRQLQLAIVSLSEKEQEEKLTEIQSLQSELAGLKGEKETELQNKLQSLYDDYEQSLETALSEARAEIEGRLKQDYLSYKMEQQAALDEEIALLEGKLRRSLASRKY